MIVTTSLHSDIDRERRACGHRNPGVLIMTSHPLLITYMNASARAILTHVHVLDGSLGMPNEIMTFCLDLLEALDDRSDMSMWTPFELEREVNIAGTWICLRGLGLPPASAVDESRICILMEERESERQSSSFV
jgi:hypothetical protein